MASLVRLLRMKACGILRIILLFLHGRFLLKQATFVDCLENRNCARLFGVDENARNEEPTEMLRSEEIHNSGNEKPVF
jgi:hypothetical protein